MPYQFWKKYEFIRYGFSLVWVLVLILIRAILKQQITEWWAKFKLECLLLICTCTYTNEKFNVKKDPILHVATTFSLKQGETRTSHGPIPHPLSTPQNIPDKVGMFTLRSPGLRCPFGGSWVSSSALNPGGRGNTWIWKWHTCAYRSMKKEGFWCKISLKKGGDSVWAPKKLGLSVCENKIFMPKFAIFFAQIDIKLYNFLIAHEACKFFSFLCRILYKTGQRGHWVWTGEKSGHWV